MKLLVSGGTGFLGQHLCRGLSATHEVHALYSSEKPEIGDVCWYRHKHGDGDALDALPDRIDGVIHLAQSNRYREFPAGAADMFAVNVDFTFRLLEYARRSGASNFVYASTGGVYEQSLKLLHETTASAPDNFYAASKLAAEMLLRPYQKFFNAAVLRLFFIYGRDQRDRLIPNLVARIRAGEDIDLYGSDGGLRITPTHVEDLVGVFDEALRKSWNGTLNVAAPEVLTIREIALILGRALGQEVRFRNCSGPAPQGLVPDLTALQQVYELSRFRRFEQMAEVDFS